jgi:aminoglycoside 3-N-acetyltransferase
MPNRRPTYSHQVGEEQAIDENVAPVTQGSIRSELASLGVPRAATVLVHSSLSRLGWVAGGAHAVVLALVEAVGPDGTLVMPTHSTHLTDPANWEHPPVPESWWPVIREQTPAFDPKVTPTRQMGVIVETFRHLPGVVRSTHPMVSFAALGPLAEEILDRHELNDGMGEGSPLGRLYDADGWVLLLGVGHANNTSLHLAEARAEFPGKKTRSQGSPMLVEGRRQWVEYAELDLDDSDFEQLGRDFAATGREYVGRIGAGTARLMRQRHLVDFAVDWLGRNRGADGGAEGAV